MTERSPVNPRLVWRCRYPRTGRSLHRLPTEGDEQKGKAATKRSETPDETRELEHGRIDIVHPAGSTAAHVTFEPSWRWATDIKPLVGTDSCQAHHVGHCVEGSLHVVTDEGSEFDIGAGTPTKSFRATRRGSSATQPTQPSSSRARRQRSSQRARRPRCRHLFRRFRAPSVAARIPSHWPRGSDPRSCSPSRAWSADPSRCTPAGTRSDADRDGRP